MIKFKKIFCTFLLCFIAFNAFAETINISVNKDVINEAETLYLTIAYDGNSKENPDLSALQNDFQIVSNSKSEQFSFINGNVSQIRKWTIGLQPLKIGKIHINSIKLNNIISNSIDVEIRELSDEAYISSDRYDRQTNNQSSSPYFRIEQNISTVSPYIQQQVTLFIKIYDSIGLQNSSLRIDEDYKKDWIIIPLSNEPVISQEVINNRHVNVLTYVLAAFPQKSGNIKTPTIHFDGHYVKNADFHFPNLSDDFKVFGMDFSNVFGQTVPVAMKTKQELISVKPIPDDFSEQYWLPLSNLEMSSTWSVRSGFKVGEAITRTINIKAYGMNKSMLPDFSFVETPNIKQYPEKPEINESLEKTQIVTDAQINNVYIPTKSGELLIPEFKISWFNVNTGKTETTFLPEEDIFVLPNESIKENFDTPKESLPVTQKEKNDSEQSKIQEDTKNDTLLTLSKIKNFQTIFLYIFLSLLLLIFLGILVHLNNKKHQNRNTIIRYLKKHQYKEAKSAILHWAETKFYPAEIKNFNDISILAKNPDFSQQLSCFNKFLYSDNSDFFDDTKFIEILKKVDRIKVKEVKKVEPLPNLYD